MEIKSAETFYRLIQQDLCLMDFHAPWCAPCHAQEPILRDLARRYAGRVFFGLVNTDLHQDLARTHAIEHVPTLIVFRKERELQRLWGLQPETVLSRELNRLLESDDQSMALK